MFSSGCLSGLSRQSTVASSLDEGVDVGEISASSSFTTPLEPKVNPQSPMTSSGELLSSYDSNMSVAGGGSPFDSFDMQIENDVMSSLSSSPVNSQNNPAGTQLLNIMISSASTHSASQAFEVSEYPSASGRPDSEGWTDASGLTPGAPDFGRRASDNAMFESLGQQIPFTQHLSQTPKTRGCTELNKTAERQSGCSAGTNPQNSELTPQCQSAKGGRNIQKQYLDRRTVRQRPPLPKRGNTLPERYEYQPYKMLLMKQTRMLEQQRFNESEHSPASSEASDISVDTDLDSPQKPIPAITDKPVLFQGPPTCGNMRIYSKRFTPRSAMLRQPSYQMAQAQSVMPGELETPSPSEGPSRFPQGHSQELDALFAEDSPALRIPTPLSPIEDAAAPEEGMDTS